ncbi:MAG: glycosyltransferase [bacterium]|nr:glycosyltransferase [bacterium]
MKPLVIGTDTAIFQANSGAERHIDAYGRLFEELHIVVYTARGFAPRTLPSGAQIYPTNSRWFFLRPFDAAGIGRRIAREHGIDVISVQDPAESGLAGWLVKLRTGLPLHIQLHTDVLSPYFRRNSWKERMRYWLARFVIPRGDAFRVVSERICISLISHFKFLISKPITVLPIFVDRAAIANAAPKFSLREHYPEFDFVILMVSRLNRDKRIDVALNAFQELLQEFPKTGLVIVGDGPEEKKLKVKSEKLKVFNSVVFEGWQRDLIPYYKGADLYLLTSAFEGYGRTVIEAAAAGAPVVMTDVGVAGEIIRDGETGRVVPVGDPMALVRALIDARRNYSATRAMADQARREVLVLEPRTWAGYLEAYRQSFKL